MDDEAEIGQVEAARGDIGGDADLGVAIAQGLQRVIAFALAHLAGEADSVEAALAQAGVQVADVLARGAEDERAAGFEIAEHVDDGAFGIAGRDAHGAVVDVAVRLGRARGVDADGVALVILRQHGDAARDGGREQQRAARVGGRRIEQRFEFFAEAEVEHLVGFVEHGDLKRGEIEKAAREVIAQAARRADDDVGAARQLLLLGADAHAADGDDDARAGVGIEPFELAADLHRKLARRRDDEGAGAVDRLEALVLAKQGGGEREAEGDGLARPGLGRDQHVGVGTRGVLVGFDHGKLDGRGLGKATRGKGAVERGVNCGEGHVTGFRVVGRGRLTPVGEGRLRRAAYSNCG